MWANRYVLRPFGIVMLAAACLVLTIVAYGGIVLLAMYIVALLRGS